MNRKYLSKLRDTLNSSQKQKIIKSLLSQLKVDFLIEYRSWAQTAAVVLFMWVIAYVIYRIYEEMGIDIGPAEFNFLYWVFMLIISVSIALRTEHHQGPEEHLMLYTLLSPTTVFLSRLLFNVSYLFLVGLAFYAAMLFLFYPQIEFVSSFLMLIALGSVGIAGALSFIAAIARYGAGQNTVLSVLSIPVLIPIILLLFNMGVLALRQAGIPMPLYITVLSISLLSIALSLILFPFVWRQ